MNFELLNVKCSLECMLWSGLNVILYYTNDSVLPDVTFDLLWCDNIKQFMIVHHSTNYQSAEINHFETISEVLSYINSLISKWHYVEMEVCSGGLYENKIY